MRINDDSPNPTLDEIKLLHARICRVLGEPKRIQILYALAENSRSVGELVEALDAPQPTISRHLAVMRETGMVTTHREATTIIYSLAVPDIINVVDSMRAILRTIIAREANSLEDFPAPE